MLTLGERVTRGSERELSPAAGAKPSPCYPLLCLGGKEISGVLRVMKKAEPPWQLSDSDRTPARIQRSKQSKKLIPPPPYECILNGANFVLNPKDKGRESLLSLLDINLHCGPFELAVRYRKSCQHTADHPSI